MSLGAARDRHRPGFHCSCSGSHMDSQVVREVIMSRRRFLDNTAAPHSASRPMGWYSVMRTGPALRRYMQRRRSPDPCRTIRGATGAGRLESPAECSVAALSAGPGNVRRRRRYGRGSSGRRVRNSGLTRLCPPGGPQGLRHSPLRTSASSLPAKLCHEPSSSVERLVKPAPCGVLGEGASGGSVRGVPGGRCGLLCQGSADADGDLGDRRRPRSSPTVQRSARGRPSSPSCSSRRRPRRSGGPAPGRGPPR